MTPRKIADQSEDLRRDPKYSEEAIIHAAEQLYLKNGSFNAKKLAQKILEDPIDLSAAIEFVLSLHKVAPVLSHKTFTRIQNETDLSDNKVNRIAQIIREDLGKFSIEAGLAEAIKNNGQKTAHLMKSEEIEFEGKDNKPRKRTLVYCSDLAKLEELKKGQSKS